MKWIKAKGSTAGVRYLISVDAVRIFEGRLSDPANPPRLATLVANLEDIEGRDYTRLYQTQNLQLASALLDRLQAFLVDPAAVLFDVEAEATLAAGNP